MVKISLCMIVKNEEKTLGRCLDSISGGVDEIIIVDTGSVDNTKKIAEKYTDKIYDFEWNDDFSAARNFSFSKATGDFLMWLDADDVMTEGELEKFKVLKDSLSEKDDIIMMKYETAFDEDGKATFYYYRERLIRKDIDWHWVGNVHEVIDLRGKVSYADISIRHMSIKTVYSDRNLKIYEKLESDGKEMSPRDRFYFGRELFYHKKYDRAIDILCDFLKDERAWVENKIEAYKILSKCYEEKGEYKEAVNSLTASFFCDIPRAEVCCDIGNLFVLMKNYKIAAYWYETALSLPLEHPNGAFIREECENYIPLMMLCVCYDRLGDIKKAEEYNKKAGTFRPNSKAYQYNLMYFKKIKNSV